MNSRTPVAGRVGRITPPGQPAVEFTYEGERVKTRKVKIMMASGVQEFAYSAEIYDDHGRLRRVCEDMAATWSGDCTGIETTYLYDVGERLTRVCLDREGQTCGQIRRFLYDHRGFLTQERHPEIGVTQSAASFLPVEIVDPDGLVEIEAADAGNDWTFYTHDARGNALTKRLEGSTDFDLDYFYDGAGRLIRVEENRGGNPRPLKDFFYGYENSGVDMRRGKLVQARRHNWIRKVTPVGALAIDPGAKDEDAVITEVFKYEGRDGRVSARQTRYNFRGETYAFNLSQTYDELGNVNALTYPRCVQAADGCNTAAPARTVTYQYNKGFLSGVPGYATNITYQAGGMLHQITHANGVVYTMEINPADGLERPYRISTTAGWDTGTYAYDGAGNIHRIGTENFRYDRLSRLVSGQVRVGVSLRTQTASFDVYGNITSLTTNGVTQSTPTDPTTNRLQSPLASYDGGGNVTVLDYGSERYEYAYDGTNMMKYLASDTGLARTFLYSADGERVVQLDCETAAGCGVDNAKHTWTLRGVGARVLRTYTRNPAGDWDWEQDYIHRGTTPLATVDSAAILYLHADHLDTPRQITRSTGAQESLHSYYPFGQEATGTAQDDVALKFTGHERDPNDNRASGFLDYMHARYCSPLAGRFMSPDPVGGDALSAQSWNRYSYARNNPLYFVDPTGRVVTLSLDSQKPEEDPLFLLFVAALKEAGASAEEIAALTVSKSGGVFVLGTGDLDFRESTNPTVKLIGEAIATDTTVDVAFGDVGEYYGGAITSTTFLDSHNLISITMDPEVISRVIVPGKFVSGPLEGTEVGLPVTLPTALVHEFGHARGTSWECSRHVAETPYQTPSRQKTNVACLALCQLFARSIAVYILEAASDD